MRYGKQDIENKKRCMTVTSYFGINRYTQNDSSLMNYFWLVRLVGFCIISSDVSKFFSNFV